MRNRSLIIGTLLSSSFFCSHSVAMEAEYVTQQTHGYPFTKANIEAFKTFVSTWEERESEEAKNRDEEGNFLIDYERMRVCDIHNNAGAPFYSEVIDEIRPLFAMVAPSQPIVMNFKGNYLQDQGVSAIVDFVLENSLLKNQLKKLNLSNNRFKASCLPKLKDLVEQCPHLEKLNIAINYISTDEVNQAFQTLSSDKKRIIDFAPY